jgi:glutathione S-transferase
MKLYVFPVAPNPTKVRLYLAEKRAAGAPLDVEERPVDLTKGEQRSPEHLARNPRGTLPVLELDDGSHLTESLAIIEYLEELCPRPAMLGETALERARTREVERMADLGVLIAAARVVHATKSPLGLPPAPEVASRARTMLLGTLEILDALLSDGRPLLAGERPTIADCTLAAALQFARFGGMHAADEFEHVRRWDAAYRQRPAAQRVLLL